MSAITYADEFGDAITEHPPFTAGGWRVVVEHNPTGFRLTPPGCWSPGCDGLATYHVVRQQHGEAQTYVCASHIADDARNALGLDGAT